jgi:uncharacterized iron-regulated protein
MVKRAVAAILLACLSSLFLFGQDEEAQTLVLNIGSPDLKDETLNIYPGKIYSLRAGNELTFDQMIQEMTSSRIIYVGESHDSLPISHRDGDVYS